MIKLIICHTLFNARKARSKKCSQKEFGFLNVFVEFVLKIVIYGFLNVLVEFVLKIVVYGFLNVSAYFALKIVVYGFLNIFAEFS